MAEQYVATWRVIIEADSIEDARRLHIEALESTSDAPCSVYVWGDGPEQSEWVDVTDRVVGEPTIEPGRPT